MGNTFENMSTLISVITCTDQDTVEDPWHLITISGQCSFLMPPFDN